MLNLQVEVEAGEQMHQSIFFLYLGSLHGDVDVEDQQNVLSHGFLDIENLVGCLPPAHTHSSE